MVTKLSLITAEAITVNKDGQTIPCIVLIGRDEQGKKKSWRTPYWPYMYIKESDFIKIKDDKELNLDKYVKEYLGTFIRSLNKKALTKLILYDYKYINTLQTLLRKYGKVEGEGSIYSYEADLSNLRLLALRWLIDKGVKSGVIIRQDNSIEPIELDVNLRIWYIDFEAYTSKMCSYGLKKEDPITMVSFYDTYEDTLYTYYVINKKWRTLPKFKKIVDRHIIKGFKSEALFLDGLREKVKQLDPDLFTAWNLDRYDIVKWFQRMKANRLHPNLLSPLKRVVTSSKPYRIKGRILFDLMKAYKRYTAGELRSYSLLNVIKEEKLKLEKVAFKGSAGETWDKYPKIVFKRNVNDVLVIKELDEKHGLINMFDDLRKEFGCLWEELFIRHRLIDTALMRFVHHKIALSTAGLNIKQEGSFLGAKIEATPGKYRFVAEFDFSREYPNNIVTFNIGAETYRRHPYKGQAYRIKYGDNVYTFVKKPISLLASLIKYFFKKRDEYEKKYSEAIKEKDEVKIKMWWRRIFNIKTVTNAIFGVTDFPSFRLYRKECSGATAVLGRIALEKVIELAEGKGHKVVYIHTDSIFIDLKSNNLTDAHKECVRLVNIFNKGLTNFFIKTYKVPKAPSNLALKRIYDNYFVITRTQSAGRYIWDEKKGETEDFDFTGLEVVRSDSSDLEKETLLTIIKMILTEKKHKDIKDYWSKVTKNFWNKVYDYLQVAYPLQIRRPFRYYAGKDKNGKPKTIPAHVRAALTSNTLLNTDFEAWDKPRRLPIRSKKRLKVKIGRGLREFKVKDIAVAEDMLVPEKYLDAIDWKRIYDRLSDKVAKIFKLIYIQSSLEGYS